MATVVLATLASTTAPAAGVGNGNGNGASGPAIVRGPDDVLLPVVGTFAGSRVVSSTCGHEVVIERGTAHEGPVAVVLDTPHAAHLQVGVPEALGQVGDRTRLVLDAHEQRVLGDGVPTGVTQHEQRAVVLVHL